METNVLHNGIRSWPSAERPRERLLSGGANRLSDAELIAILLGSGIRGKDAVALGRELLAQFGGLRGLFSSGAEALGRTAGLGQAKSAALLAVRELARRLLLEELPLKDAVRDPQAVLDYVSAELRDRKREVFKVLFLNKANCVTGEADLFHGTVDEAAVHPREIVRAALERSATAVILVHNHPSGRAEPSPEDQEITKKIKAACETVSIRVLDHLIIGDNRYFSFREAGMI